MVNQPAYTTPNNGIPQQEAVQIKAPAIGEEQLRTATQTLLDYKKGKDSLDNRIIKNEEWWKLRHWEYIQGGNTNDKKPTSAWLFNVVMGKHADAMAAYPEPNIRPREEGDKQEAKMLTSIIPCVLEQNDFEETYSQCQWQKTRQGTAMYGIFWDKSLLNGLGDISIKKVDVLNLFWEPGIKDLQRSKNLFHTELVDNDTLVQMYPQMEGKLRGDLLNVKKFVSEDSIDTSKKSVVIDWYYHKYQNGKKVLHYCKYCNTTVLYSTENDTEPPMMEQIDPATGIPMEIPAGQAAAERGWYDDGNYPFVADVLFPVEDSICGFSYIDVGKSAQEAIDLMNQAIVKNCLMGATPRYFSRQDGGINEEEFADWTKGIVHTTGNVGQEFIQPIAVPTMSSLYVDILNNKVEELKWTTGNTDVSNGTTSSGVTAASAIAALQETAGRSSKDATKSSYRAYRRIISMVIERIRQFYDMPRKFRIMGEYGAEEYTTYSNMGLQPQAQGNDFGINMGYRMPVFDIKVSAQKANEYTKMAQNELALQFYDKGFFNPQQVDQALATLEMMDFDEKDNVLQKVQKNGTMYQQLLMYQQMALALAQKYEPQMAEGLAQNIMGAGVQQLGVGGESTSTTLSQSLKGNPTGENAIVSKAREKSQKASQPE